jgi:hypothetical protein
MATKWKKFRLDDDDTLWDEFTACTGPGNASDTIRGFMAWFTNRPGAELPTRPKPGRPRPQTPQSQLSTHGQAVREIVDKLPRDERRKLVAELTRRAL